MTAAARDTLIAHGVDEAHPPGAVHRLCQNRSTPGITNPPPSPSTIREQETFDLVAGDSILEGALQIRSARPYSCMGARAAPAGRSCLTGQSRWTRTSRSGATTSTRLHLTCQSHQQAPPCRSTTTHKNRDGFENNRVRTKARTAGCSRWPRAAPPMHRRSADPTGHSCATCKTRSSTLCNQTLIGAWPRSDSTATLEATISSRAPRPNSNRACLTYVTRGACGER